jgi:acyl carrier protein phosphodiesterase
MKNNQVEYAEDLLNEFVHLDIWAALYSFGFNSRYSKKKPTLQMLVCHDNKDTGKGRPDHPENFNLVNKFLWRKDNRA